MNGCRLGYVPTGLRSCFLYMIFWAPIFTSDAHGALSTFSDTRHFSLSDTYGTRFLVLHSALFQSHLFWSCFVLTGAHIAPLARVYVLAILLGCVHSNCSVLIPIDQIPKTRINCNSPSSLPTLCSHTNCQNSFMIISSPILAVNPTVRLLILQIPSAPCTPSRSSPDASRQTNSST